MTKPVHQFDRLPGGQRAGRAARAGRAGHEMVTGSVDRPEGEPLVGLLYNSNSHRNRGRDLEEAARPGVLVAMPETRDDTPAVMEYFAQVGIDYLVINGGDGTVRDALTAAAPFFGENWPVLAVLPKGKTNALNVDLNAPANWDLTAAIEAYHRGSRITRRPFAISELNADLTPGPDAEDEAEDNVLLGFIIGGGAIATGVEVGQQAHKLGAFNSFAVGATGAWGVLQAIFGSDENIWRRGAKMNFRLGRDRVPLAHSGHGNPERRSFLLATTLDKLPMGIRPFGKQIGDIRMAVLDKPRRRMVLLLPAIVAGYSPDWLGKSGYHQVTAEQLELDIGDSFILDGEAFPAGSYLIEQGPELIFVVP